MRWTVVGEMNEMDCGLKEIKTINEVWWTQGNKMKHDQ